MAEDDAPRRPVQSDDSGYWQGRDRRVNSASNADKSQTFQDYREIERRQYPGRQQSGDDGDEKLRKIFERNGWDADDPATTTLFADWIGWEIRRYKRCAWWANLRQPAAIALFVVLVGWAFGQPVLSWLWSHLMDHVK